MTQDESASEPTSMLDSLSERRLVRLLFARLALTVLSFGIPIGLDGLGREFPPSARQALYLTVAVAFASTVVSGLFLTRARSASRFAAVQIATDVGIVTSLVYFSGGRDSIFTFLYVVVTLYGAVLFERRGAMLAASLSAAAYGGVIFGSRLLEADGGEAASPSLPIAVRLAIWGVHVGALYLVGVLASLLSSELERTGLALDRSTNDLRRLSSLHQRIVDSIMSGLLTTDTEGRITSFNPEAERITGLTSDQALGRDVEDVIPRAEPSLLATGRDDRPSSGPRPRLEYRNAEGQDLYLGLASSVLRDSDGEPRGHVVIFQDVTDVVAMERELRSSERMAAVGEMAAKIAHEIRNPLASISGSIQMLQLDQPPSTGGAESETLMEIVVRETDRLNGLITDFLQYSRPTPPVLKVVPVRAELDVLIRLLEASMPDGVEVVVEGSADARVLADPDQLRQVLWNLSHNGLQAMPRGGRLKLSVGAGMGDPPQEPAAIRRNVGSSVPQCAAPDSGFVEISISDDGVGIPAEIQERIFEPFYTTKREGTGLGLATVHRIVESHGGSLTLASEEGRGTTCRVFLPAAEEVV